VVSQVGAIGKHLALIGFMGAGKTTIGRQVAERIARPFVDTDEEIEQRFGPISELFEGRGESEFRRIEEQVVAEALAGPDSVIALGGGAVLSDATRERLRARALTIFLDVEVDTAWERVRGSDRPLARHEDDFRRLYETRQRFYIELADDTAEDAISPS
jgi:shikimate kinase